MKKILFISHETQLNGAPQSLVSIANILKENYNITFLIPDQEGPLIEKLNKYGFKYHVIKQITLLYKSGLFNRLYMNLVVMIKLYRYFMQERFYILHLNTFATRYAALPGFLSGSRIIWFLREYYHNKYIQKSLSLIVKIFSDSIAVNSRYLKKTTGIKNAKVIYNSITIPEFEKIKLPKGKNLVYIGRISKEKGIQELLQAIVLLQDTKIHLNLVGNCEDQDYFDTIIKEHNLNNNIHFHGFQKDTSQYINAARILILPSRRESFGRVILESFAHSRPVIATNVGGIPEIVDKSCGILVKPKNAESLAEAISLIINDDTKIITMGKCGYSKLRQYFSEDVFICEIKKLHY